MKSFRAFFKGDDPPIQFNSEIIDDELWFVMENDSEFKYSFSVIFMDDYWTIEVLIDNKWLLIS